MAITPILNNNIESVIRSEINSKYEQVEKVAKDIESVVALAGIMDQAIDFKLLADVLINLDSVSAANLADLATVDLVEMTQDLAKSNYLGNRKLDIDLSLNIDANGNAVYYQQVNIITVDGVRIQYPFYASGTTTIEETASPSLILQHIKTAIADYNSNEPDPALQVLNTEYDLLNEVDPTKPTIIRIRDVDGKASGISRIELIRYVSGVVDNYYWAKTTSSLQTLANRVGDLITLGNNISDIIVLASKVDEVSFLYDKREELVGISNSLYSELATLQKLYDNLTTLTSLEADLATVNAVANELPTIGEVKNNLSIIDTVAANVSKTAVVANDIDSVVAVYSDIAKGAGNNTSNDSAILNALTNALTALQAKVAAIAAKDAAEQKATEAAQSASDAETSATNSAQAAVEAEAAKNYTIGLKDTVETYKKQLTELTADAHTLVPGSNATASYNSTTGVLTLGVPKGDKGDRGEAFKVDAVGVYAERVNYDHQPKGYAFLSTNGYGPQPDETIGTNYESILTPAANSTVTWNGQGLTLHQEYEFIVEISNATAGAVTLYNDTVVINTYSTNGSSVKVFEVVAADIHFTVDSAFDGSIYIEIKKKVDQSSLIFFKTSDSNGDYWSVGSPFGKGDQGDRGISILGVSFVATTDPSGQPGRLNAVDTYKISYSDGTSDTFEVNNGKGTTVLNLVEDTQITQAPTIALCDTTIIQQKDKISNITVADSTTYTVTIDGVPCSYTSDAYHNKKATIDNITVIDNTDYSVDITIGGVVNTATYHSDAAVQQVDEISVSSVQNDTDYSITLNNTTLTYHSDAAVQQINTLTNVTVADNTDYIIDIDGTVISYHSDPAVSQVDEVTSITVVDNQSYALTVNGTEVSYTSGINATLAEIQQGLVNAVSSNAVVNGIVTAATTLSGIKLTGVTAGEPFSTAITSGAMSLSTTVVANKATATEIYNGLKAAINSSGLPVTSDNIPNGIKITANTAGVGFSLTVQSNNIANSIVVANNYATVDKIVAGLRDVINASTEPVDAVVVGTKVVLTAHIAGNAFTLTAVTNNLATVNTTPNNKAELPEITAGLTNAVNALGIGVTATDKGTYLVVTANTHTTDFTITANANMTITVLVADEATLDEIVNGLANAINSNVTTAVATAGTGYIDIAAQTAGVQYTITVTEGPMTLESIVVGQAGAGTVTLLNNPSIGDIITIVDVANSFETRPLTVLPANGDSMNGSTVGVDLDVNGVVVDFIYSGVEWRYA